MTTRRLYSSRVPNLVQIRWKLWQRNWQIGFYIILDGSVWTGNWEEGLSDTGKLFLSKTSQNIFLRCSLYNLALMDWEKGLNRLSPVYSSDECTGICAARHVEREWSFKNLVQSLQRKQEAQLSPSDRAMRLVSSNLANYHATVQKLLIRQVLTKPMVWGWRFSWRQCVINKPTTVELCISPYTDDLLWRNFLSPQCRNCSRDPDHAHLGNTHSSQD